MLRARQFPRLHMMGMLALAASAGFLTTAGLLRLGVATMPVRYAAAMVVSYAALLALLKLWLRWQLPDTRTRDRDWSEALDVDLGPHAKSRGTADDVEYSGSGVNPGDALHTVLDHEDGFAVLLPLLVVGALVLIFGTVGGVVATAPALLAEVLVDAALAAGVYRGMRHLPVQHWTAGVVRRTWLAATLVGLTVVFAAVVAQHYVPSAASIGDFMRKSVSRTPGTS